MRLKGLAGRRALVTDNGKVECTLMQHKFHLKYEALSMYWQIVRFGLPVVRT